MNGIEDRRILITGGCGSIGSLITESILELDPEVVRILDNDEQQIFDFNSRLDHHAVEFVLGNIRDASDVAEAFEDIDLVLHTAALKHVGLAEKNPFQAAKTNIDGTKNVITSSLKQGVNQIVSLSTDKASNPSSAMGASKLLAERIVIASNRYDTTASCVRLGNVLGTRGSVVPVFLNQIRRGGPVTVTDPDMTRFVIQPTDAANFIVDSVTAMSGGEIILPDMPALRIGDLAEAMRDRYGSELGFEPDEIEISLVGARPGERYHEKLIAKDEARYAFYRDDRYVLYPHADNYDGERPAWESVLSDEVTSEDADRLTKREIISWIEESHLVHGSEGR